MHTFDIPLLIALATVLGFASGIGLYAVLLILAIWLLPKLVRFIARVVRRLFSISPNHHVQQDTHR